MILPDLILHTKKSLILSESGIDSLKKCNKILKI
jgi:hypothetical protein